MQATTVDPRPSSEAPLDQVFKGSLTELKGWFQQLDTTLSKVIESSTTQTKNALFNAVEQQTQLLLDEARQQAQSALDTAVTPLLAAALAGNGGLQGSLLSSFSDLQIPRRRLAQIPLFKKENLESMLAQMSEVSQAMLSVEAKAVQQEILEKIKDSLRYYGIKIPKTVESRSVGSVDPGSVDAAIRAAQDTMGNALIMELVETIQSMINAVNQTATTTGVTAVPRRRALLSTSVPAAAPSVEDEMMTMAEAPAAEGRFAPVAVPDLATAVENLQTEVQGMLTAVEKALKAPEKFMKKLFSSVKTAAEEMAENVESNAKSMIELSKDFLSQGKEQRQAVKQLGEDLQLRQLKELAQAHNVLSKYRSLREKSPGALASHYRQLAAVASSNNNVDSMDVLLEDLNNNPVEDVVLDVMSEGELVMGIARLLQEVEDQQDAIQQGKLEKGVVVIEMTPISSVMLLNDMIGLTNELLGFMMMPVPMVEIDFFELAQAPASEMWMVEETISSSGSFWQPPEPTTDPPSSPSYASSDVQRFRRLLNTFSDKKSKSKNIKNHHFQEGGPYEAVDDGYPSEIERYYGSYDSDILYAYDDLYAYREGAFQDDWFFAPADAVPGSGDDGALLAVVIRAVTPQAGSIGLPPALLQLLLDESGKSNEQLASLLSAAASVSSSAAAQAGAGIVSTTTTTTELPAYNIFGPKPTSASDSAATGQAVGTAASSPTRQQSVVIVEQQQQHHGSHLPERLSSQARTVAIPHDSTAAGSDLSVNFWAAGVGAGFIGLLIGGIVVAVMSRGGNGDNDGYGGGRGSRDDTYLLLPSPAEQVLLPPSARKSWKGDKDSGEGMKPAVGETPRKLSNLPA